MTTMFDQDEWPVPAWTADDPLVEPASCGQPAVRVVATYPPGARACPETVTVELNSSAAATLGLDIRSAVHALATVAAVAGSAR